MIDPNFIDQCFPKPSYRPQQKEVIQSIIHCINSGKKYIIAELPTGTGKSPIAVTLARLVESAYYITTTKILQDQIENDFGDSIATLKGRSNYPCTVYDNFKNELRKQLGTNLVEQDASLKPSCSEGHCKKRLGSSKCRLCVPTKIEIEENPLPNGLQHSYCPYYERYYRAANSKIASMNFDNFILHLNYGKTFGNRKLLIIDEAHNTEEKLLNFLETTISSKHISNRIPKLETPLEYINWLKRIDATGTLKERYEEARGSLNIKLMQHYENLLMKYVNFIIEVTNDPTGWVVEYSTENDEDIVSAKPIFVKSAAKKLLFSHADIIIFLSATILNANTFANNLGINKDEYSAYRIGSNFPVENRPIILDYAGKFTGGKDKQQIWIKPLTRKVEEIARNFPNERGIIHTHSFGIQKGIVENAALDVRKRFLEQHNFINKTEMLEHHAKTPGSIIIAPAMHEGIDLKDDLSRFQILCKVPYANYYENIQLMARMELDPPYYEYITIMKLVQSVGRSVRSETDWAYTYIIDESFERIYKTNNSFPLWFKEAVTKNLKSKINVGS